MTETRKIAAILVSDVVGYSRLVGADEDRTLARLRALRSDMIDPTIAVHHGRVVKRTGDGAIVEFRSVIDAVRCAIEVQSGMVERNAGLPPERRIEFRIGIHLGDVVEESDGDLMGDGVNIAARLEGICEVGGVCISEDAYRQVRDKIKEQFVDLGEQALKNIARPMRAYQVKPGETKAEAAALEAPSAQLALPDKPSIAVLPFQNMSGDPEQDYFADGIVEDIITALSRFKSFAVVARNSSFVYKGRAVDVRQAAKELGVRYVLEGSVRRAGNRLRITAQLIEAESGAHLWAQNFDGAVEDVFDVQDRITENVVAIVEPRMRRAEIERARRKRPDSLDAYDLYLQALPDIYAMRPELIANAIRLLEQAIALDPGFAPALSMAAQAYLARFTQQLAGGSDADATASIRYSRAALATGSDDAAVLATCGFSLIHTGRQYEEGFAVLKRAVAENPNNVTVLTFVGIGYLLGGDLDESEAYLERAIRLNPNEFGTHWQLTGIAHIRMAQGRYEEALEVANRSLAMNRGYDATYWMLIAANAHLNRMENARNYVTALQALSPGVSLSRIRHGQHFKDPHRIEVLIEGMRKAGMPET